MLQFGKEHVERKLLCRAKGERCLPAASSSKPIGAGRASHLQLLEQGERVVGAGRASHLQLLEQGERVVGAGRASDLQ